MFRRYAFQIFGAMIAVLYLLVGIFRSTNSTASIGFLFLPVAAAIGAFGGDAIQYGLDLVRKKRAPSIVKTVVILVALGFCVSKFVQTRGHSTDMQPAENPATPDAKLGELLQKNDAEVARAVASNPSLSETSLAGLIQTHLTDYDVMSGAVQNPHLTAPEMGKIVALERSDFRGDAEYEVYQTYVWAPLARRKDIPENLVHQLAGKQNPRHFLILALLESSAVSCDEKKRFLPQTNAVLENAIQRSMLLQNCPQN